MADLRVIDSAPVNAGVVDFLEGVLAKAKDDELSAVAVALVYRDGSTGSGWSTPHSLSSIVGAVEAMKAKLVRDMIE